MKVDKKYLETNKSKDIKILFLTPQCEVELKDLCITQYKRINELMKMIEDEFGTDMANHYEIRNRILDTSNFIKRLPEMLNEIIVTDEDFVIKAGDLDED